MSNIDERTNMNEQRFEHIENSLVRMEDAIGKQAESMGKISEAVIRMSAQQEIMQSLVLDNKINRDRIAILERKSDVQQEVNKRVPDLKQQVDELEDDVIRIDKKQVKNTVTITAIVSAIVMIGNYVMPMIFGG